MPIFIRVALAIDLLLIAVEHASPKLTAGVLPLGGSEFSQLAIILLLGIVAVDFFSKPKRKE